VLAGIWFFREVGWANGDVAKSRRPALASAKKRDQWVQGLAQAKKQGQPLALDLPQGGLLGGGGQ